MENKKTIKIGEETYKKIVELTLFSGVPIYKLVDLAWVEFSKSKKYASLKLLGKDE